MGENDLQWPVAAQNSLLIGDEDSPVAVCTLWSQRDVMAKFLDPLTYALLGNLYSGGGINAIVRNILAKPTIKYIVIYGADLSGSGDDVLKFFEKGVVEGKIVGSNIKMEPELGLAYELVRKHVLFVDMRKKSPDELRAKLAELSRKKIVPFANPQTFPESKKVVTYIENELTGFSVRGKTISQAWLQVLDLIMKYGMETPTEYGNRQKEVISMLAVIDESEDAIPDFIGFSQADLERYVPTILTAEKDDKVAYTYGERLHSVDPKIGMSQVQAAVSKLKKNIDTRRAIAFTWHPEDHVKSDTPPCLTQISWRVQHNKLFQTVVFRSHDMYEGWPMNLYALRRLQENISKDLNVECGPLTCLSISAHIYENRWEDAKDILKKQLKVDHATFECDKRGVFHIGAEGEEMVVTHLTKDGQKTGFEFRGKEVHTLLDEVVQSNLMSRMDHAAYMGRELQKLWVCMKLGKPYVQDKQMPL